MVIGDFLRYSMGSFSEWWQGDGELKPEPCDLYDATGLHIFPSHLRSTWRCWGMVSIKMRSSVINMLMILNFISWSWHDQGMLWMSCPSPWKLLGLGWKGRDLNLTLIRPSILCPLDFPSLVLNGVQLCTLVHNLNWSSYLYIRWQLWPGILLPQFIWCAGFALSLCDNSFSQSVPP